MKIQINKHKKGGFTLIELMVVIAILASLAAIGYGPIMDHMGDGDRQQASSNLGQVQKLLMAFKGDYSSYPCDSTADSLQEDNAEINFGDLKGDHSNAYFRQLFYKHINSEGNFYAKIQGVKEADNRIANGAALERGENGMAYIMLKPKAGEEDVGKRGVSASNAPLALCCVARSSTPMDGTNVQFDMESFRGHAFVVNVDGSVKDLMDKIEEDDNDSSIGKLKTTIFPETRKGRDTSGDYVVLTPEL